MEPSEVETILEARFKGWVIPLLLNVVVVVEGQPRIFLSPEPKEKQ